MSPHTSVRCVLNFKLVFGEYSKKRKLNEKELTGQITQGYEDQSNESSNMVSEDSCNRKQEELESVCRELAKEKTELQGINTELNVRLLDETEKRSKLQTDVASPDQIASSDTLGVFVNEIAISLSCVSRSLFSSCNFDHFSVSSNNLTLSSVFIPCSSVFSLASSLQTLSSSSCFLLHESSDTMFELSFL